MRADRKHLSYAYQPPLSFLLIFPPLCSEKIMFLLSATEHLDKIVGIGKNQMVLCSIKGIEGRCFRQNVEDKSAHICLVLIMQKVR